MLSESCKRIAMAKGEGCGVETIQYFLVELGMNPRIHLVKYGYSEKSTKFEKIFHLKFDITE